MNEPFEFTVLLKVANEALDRYAQRHPKWFKRIAGTPIENDLCVLMAEEFKNHIKSNLTEDHDRG